MALAGLALVGCGAPPSSWRVHEQLLDPALEGWAAAAVTTHAVVERWASDASPWHSASGVTLHADAQGLTIDGLRRKVWLERTVSLDATSIDALAFATAARAMHGVLMEWAAPGEDFDVARRVEATRTPDWQAANATYRFALRGHPAWHGPIERIRLRIDLRQGSVTLGTLDTWRETIDEDGLTTALAGSWQVTMDHETRPARASLPGVTWTHELRPPRGAQLRLGFGVDAKVHRPIDFVVWATTDDDATASAVELWRATVPANNGRWQAATIDLSALADRTTTLTFATTAPDGYDPRIGFAYWAHPEIVVPAADRPPNVVLISIDTLRADHLSLYGYPRSTSPHLDAWAHQRATVFETTVAPSPWTLPSHVSMLSGLDATRHGINHRRPMPARITSIAEHLRDAGWATGAITGGGFVHPQYGLAQGFDGFRIVEGTMGNGQELASGLARARRWLDVHADRPFFLFFHTYEVHMPLRPRAPFFEAFSAHRNPPKITNRTLPLSPDDGYRRHQEWVIDPDDARPTPIPDEWQDVPTDLYDAGVAYADQQIGRLLRHLETLGLDERTIVVVTSDHGEMMGEYGAYNHEYLYDENLLVPLLVAAPGGRGAGRRVDTQVRTVDIVPTVLALAGLKPPDDLDGVSLVPLMDGRALDVPPAWSYAAASNWGLSLRVRNRFKYVVPNAAWNAKTLAPEALYDLRRGEAAPIDDAEALAGYRRQVVPRLDAQLPGLRVALHNATRRHLRGYLDGRAIGRYRVKRTTVERCDCIHYQPGTGRLRFRLAPRQTTSLLIEDVPRAPLVVGIERHRGQFARHTIDVGAIDDAGLVLEWRAAGWQQRQGIEARGTGLAFTWQGEAEAVVDEAPEAGNEALREQLRALGYLGG